MRREVLVALALAVLIVSAIVSISPGVTTAANEVVETSEIDLLSLSD